MDKLAKLFVLTVLAVILLSGSVAARERKFGLGIMIGEPAGVNAKLWIGEKTAFAAAVAWSLGDNGASYLYADYILHNFNVLTVERGSFPFYYGIGSAARLSKHERVGIRIPLGLAYILEGAAVDIFLEIVPLVIVVPDTDIGIHSGLGVRYFFR